MRSPVPPSERFGRQNAEREQQRRDVDDALRIDGSQFIRLYEKMQALIANLQTTVTNLVTSLTYTRAQVDARIASPGNISPGHVIASGNVSANAGSFPAGLSSVDVYNHLVTGGGAYRATWVHETGFLGYAPSSRRFKTNERPARFTVEQVLQIQGVIFQYYATPPYAQELQRDVLGAIAEDVEAAGFPWLVDYDEDGRPFGLNNEAAWVVILEGMRDLYARTLGAT